MWWISDSLTVRLTLTGCPTLWTFSLGLYLLSERKVSQFLIDKKQNVILNVNVPISIIGLDCFQWRRCLSMFWTFAPTTSWCLRARRASKTVSYLLKLILSFESIFQMKIGNTRLLLTVRPTCILLVKSSSSFFKSTCPVYPILVFSFLLPFISIKKSKLMKKKREIIDENIKLKKYIYICTSFDYHIYLISSALSFKKQ